MILRTLVVGAVIATTIQGASGAESAAVSGTVVNGTAGASVPPGLEVTAAQLDSEGRQVDLRRGALGPGGDFRIEGFGNSPGLHYVVSAGYRGVNYTVVVDGGPSEVEARLTIYETTRDESVVTIPADTMFVAPREDGAIEVLQQFRIVNTSDRTYVGASGDDSRAVVTLPVPRGAFDLAPVEGIDSERVFGAGGGMALSEPLQPGETALSYLYRVRVPAGLWPLERRVFYPTERLDLLVRVPMRVSSTDLRPHTEAEVEGESYRVFRGGPLDAGYVVVAEVTTAAGVSVSLWVGLAAIMAVLLALLATAGWARRRSRRTRPSRREELVDAIARLDEQFEAGGMEEEAYRRRREEIKARLLKAELDGAKRAERPAARAGGRLGRS
jgi:uncharacterized membrane protein